MVGQPVMLQTTDLESVTSASVTGESFTSDVDGEVMVDMSGMMSGFVGYSTHEG